MSRLIHLCHIVFCVNNWLAIHPCVEALFSCIFILLWYHYNSVCCCCYVSDVEGGLAISSDTLSPFEKSNATLTCKASIYVFNRIQWSYTSSDNVTSVIKRRDEGVSIAARSDDFSKVSVLTLHNLKLNDTGRYHCMAIQRENGHNYTATTPLFVTGERNLDSFMTTLQCTNLLYSFFRLPQCRDIKVESTFLHHA